MNKVLIPFFLVFSCLNTYSQSALDKLVDRVYELQQLSEDQQVQIQLLEQEVVSLSSRNYGNRKENQQLRKTIQSKTQKIYELRGALSDLQFEYDKLLLELDRLAKENELFEDAKIQLMQEKEKLLKDLEIMNKTVDKLEQNLDRANLRNEKLEAQNEALNERINLILNEMKSIWFVEIEGLVPHGYRFSISKGNLIRGNNMYAGLKLGYANVRDDNFGVELFDVSVIPISLEIKIAMNKRRLGFEYIGLEESPFDHYKMFLSFAAGWSPALNADPTSDYNQGGINVSCDMGYILNVTENANGYAFVGIFVQALRNKETGSNKHAGNFRIGLGAMF